MRNDSFFYLLGIIGLTGFAGFCLALRQPEVPAIDLASAFCSPSLRHLMGCDAYGNDLTRLVLMGAWHSLALAVSTVSMTALLGLLCGTALAFAPPLLGTIGLRLVDCFLAFPGLLLAILLASLMKPSSGTVMVSLIAMGWASQARLVRALLLQTIPMPFIEASRAAGASGLRILFKDLYPALWGQLAIQWVFALSGVILGEASLSFLGLGGPIGQTSWGSLIAEGRNYLVEAPHLSLFPGAALFLTVLGFQLMARKLRARTLQ